MAKNREKPSEGEKIDFEAALVELEEIVHVLEDGNIGLSDSLARYEKGVRLLRHCYEMLDGAQRRIELLTGVDTQGRPIAMPVDDIELTLDEKAKRRSRQYRTQTAGTNPIEGYTAEGNDMDAPGSIT